MAGFKEGALQLKKKDSLAPSDVGTMKVLINSSGQMYTVNELGVSALIQGGGGDDHKVISTSADTLPGTLSEKLVAGTNVYISAIGPTTSANLEIGTLGKLGVTSGDVQAYLQNKIVAGTGTIFEVIDGAYGKQIRISLDGSGGSNIDWPVITNVPIASTSTSGVLTSTDWNTFNNKQGALTSASNVRVGNLSATNLYENGVLLSSKYSLLTHKHGWGEVSAVPVASTSTSGVLTSTDWNTFNNKQAALSTSSNLVVNSVSATNITATNFVEAGTSLSSKYLRLTGGTMTGAIVMGAATVTSSSILGSSRNFVFEPYAGITHFNSFTQIGIGGTISPGVVGASDGPFIYGYGGVSLGYTNQTSASGLVAALKTQGTNVFVAGSIYEAGVSLSSKYAPISHTQSWTTITAVPVASTSTSGVLTSTDWNTFNSKQAALSSASNIVVNSVSATSISGTTIYENGSTLVSKYSLSGHTHTASNITNFNSATKTYSDTLYLPISGIDASKIITGTIDPARIPVLPSQVPQVTTNIPSLSVAQQNIITSGTIVTTSDDGFRYVYSGTGSKTTSASYIILSDISPDWTTISNRPTNVSYWTNDSGYLTTSTGDTRYYTKTQTDAKYLPFTGGSMSGPISMGAGGTTSASTLSTTRGYLFDPYSGIVHFNSATQSGVGGSVGAADGPFLFGWGGVALGYTNVTSAGGLVAALKTQGNNVYIAGSLFESGAMLSSKYVSLSGTYNNPSWITAIDAAKVTQTSAYRFVTDTEKTTWNNKQNGSSVLTSVASLSAGIGLLKLTNGTASLDTNTYATTTQLGNYLPLAGGTMTGTIYAKTINITDPSTITLPLNFTATGNTTDNKIWDNYVAGTSLLFRTVNDAYSAATTWLEVIRSGNSISSINFGKRPTFLGNVAWDSGNFTPGNYLTTTSGDARYLRLAGGFMNDGASIIQQSTANGFRIWLNPGEGTVSDCFVAVGRTNNATGPVTRIFGDEIYVNGGAVTNGSKVWHSGNLVGNQGTTHTHDQYALASSLGNYLPMSHSIGSTDLYSFTYTEGANTGSLNLNLLDDNDGTESFKILNGAGNHIANFYSNRVSNLYSIQENGVALSSKYHPLENQRLSTNNEVSFSGLKLGYYSNATYSGIWHTSVTKGDNNWAFLTYATNNQTYLNASSSLELQIFDGTNRNTRLQITNTAINCSAHLLGATSYNIGAPANWWGSGYFTDLNVSNNTVWHAGNLTGNQTGHVHNQYVDLSSAQSITGAKTFSSAITCYSYGYFTTGLTCESDIVTWSNIRMTNGGVIRGVSRTTPNDGGTTVYTTSTGTSGAISNGVTSVNINKHQYSGFAGYVGTSADFYGMCNDHEYNSGAQLSIIAGYTTGSIGFFAGAPTVIANGRVQAPKVGKWNNAGLEVYGTLSSSSTTTSFTYVSSKTTASSMQYYLGNRPGASEINGLMLGTGDDANYTTYNWALRTHWSIGIRDYTETVRIVLDARTGNINTLGTVNSNSVVTNNLRLAGGVSSSYAVYTVISGTLTLNQNIRTHIFLNAQSSGVVNIANGVSDGQQLVISVRHNSGNLTLSGGNIWSGTMTLLQQATHILTWSASGPFWY